jgi:hypothetical protein
VARFQQVIEELALDRLSRELDSLLMRRAAAYPRREEPLWTQLRQTLEAFAAEVWARATAPAAPAPDPGRVAALEALAERPVFVLGYYKSGTSLLLNLLDGHPDVVALPSESRHFPRFVDRTEAMSPEQTVRLLQVEWVRRTVSPYGIPPFWTLGEPSGGDDDPYVLFTVYLRRFAEARGGRDLLGAVAQAVAATTGASPRVWVEKTPTHEFQLDRIRAAYPEARFVHVVRDPRSTIQSILRFDGERPIVDPLTAAAEIARSFEVAAREAGDGYLVVRYEDLVEQPAAVMLRVAQAVEIPFDETLLAPTAGGRPAMANAGRAERRVVGEIHRLSLGDGVLLDRRSRALVAALAAREARAHGYELPRGNPVVRLLARARLWTRYRLGRR